MQLNKDNASDTEAPFLDLHLSIYNGFVSHKIYDKRDEFEWPSFSKELLIRLNKCFLCGMSICNFDCFPFRFQGKDFCNDCTNSWSLLALLFYRNHAKYAFHFRGIRSNILFLFHFSIKFM